MPFIFILSSTVRLHHPHPQSLASLLTKYDRNTSVQTFLDAFFPCAICLNSFKGSSCLRLSCSHVFCRRCLTEFWATSISQGEIDKVGCADPECMKKKIG